MPEAKVRKPRWLVRGCTGLHKKLIDICKESNLDYHSITAELKHWGFAKDVVIDLRDPDVREAYWGIISREEYEL